MSCGVTLLLLSELSRQAITMRGGRSEASEGRVKGFERGVVALVGYLIAHDAHHRGHALLTLKQCGVQRPECLRYGLWDWNRI